MISALPYEASVRGTDGGAVIRCQVTVTGALTGCAILSEKPEGAGFGEAALTVAPIFLMKPQLLNGQPIAGGIVTIPLNWKLTAGTFGQRFYMLNDAAWLEAPTGVQVTAAYPAKARGSAKGARVVLRCSLTPEGRLRECGKAAAYPDDGAFLKAARDLTPYFRADLSALKVPYSKTRVDVAFSFVDPESAARRDRALLKPQWLTVPSSGAAEAYFPPQALAAGLTTGRAVVQCRVGANGGLVGCSSGSEEPAAMGFGAAAVTMASLMVMNPWSAEGVPAEGMTVRFPLRVTAPAASATPAPQP